MKEWVVFKTIYSKKFRSFIHTKTKYEIVNVVVESVIKVLSLCHLVNEAIPIPCMNKEMTPIYDNIIPFCSGAIPNCSMAITVNL